MANVNVTFEYLGDEMQGAQVDDAQTVGAIAAWLVKQKFLPPPTQNEHYVFRVEGKVELLEDSDVFRSSGVANEDVIHIRRLERGGGLACFTILP